VRVEQALAARTRDELHAVTRDLPAIAPTRSLQPGQGTVARQPVRASVSIMSGVERKGFWRVDEETLAVAVMGSCKLDLRGAAISAPVTTINAYSLMGTVDVIVPFGVEVELEGIAIMGSKEAKLSGPPPGPGAPVVRINAFALMGTVIVRDKPNLGERMRKAIEDRLSGER
jgi:Cell wall-active antibiotics response 4TMS YvqF